MPTDREQDAYQFIVDYMQRHRRAPLLNEIAAGLGIRSKGVVHRYLSALEAQGYIRRHSRHRGIELLDNPIADELPLLGKIAAGRPIEAIEDQQSLNFSQLLVAPDRYVLQVTGHSMIDAGIRDGDYVVVQRGDTARSQQIVVALVDQQEVTLKRISYPATGTVRLTPENSRMKARDYRADRVSLQGTLVGQMRMYV